jgi:uncharacterized protein
MDAIAKQFWSTCSDGKLRFQSCANCLQPQYFPRGHCVNCNNDRIEWRSSQGIGTIYSITKVQRAPTEEFRALVPYAIALIDLDEGVRIMAHANLNLNIGDRVGATFFNHNEYSLPRFEAL